MRIRRAAWWCAALLLAAVLVMGASCEPAPPLPDTTASAVMAYLADVDYQQSWELWPELGELYESEEPHGLLLTTYLNRAASEALADKAGVMPDGAIIVKENYTAAGVFDSTTVMYKRAGYNPDHNDWFWAKVAADGAVLKEGRVEGCQNCHGDASGNDYVMTDYLR